MSHDRGTHTLEFGWYPIRNVTRTPISSDRERSLIRRWQKRRDYRARDELIRQYMLFSVKKARQFYRGCLPSDECLSLAHEALMDAIDRFNIDRYTEIRLSVMILYSLRIVFRAKKRRERLVKIPGNVPPRLDGRFVSLEEIVTDGGSAGANKPLRLADTLAERADPADVQTNFKAFFDSRAQIVRDEEDRERTHRYKTLKAALATLKPKDQEVLRAHFFKNRTLAEIGRDLNLTREAIRQRRKVALRRLKLKLRKAGVLKGGCDDYLGSSE